MRDLNRIALLHGFTQTGQSWRHVAARLGGAGELTTVDLPGHGDAGHLRAGLWSTASIVADQVGRAIYVGYSMGGRTALHLALARPDLVSALVLLGATAGITDDSERMARCAADNELADTIERDGVAPFLDRWLAQPLFATLPTDPVDVADRRRNTAAGLAWSLRLAGTGVQASLWPRLAELSMPVLVVAGELDTKFTALGHQLVAGIGANARFAAIPNAGHAAHLEQPDAFAELVRSFQETLPQRA